MANGYEETRAQRLGAEIVERAEVAIDKIALVCPYVTSEAIVRAVKASSARTKRLVTRLDPSDIVGASTGSTDLAFVLELVSAGVEVRVFRGVHAKVYILDNWAYVGSANLTKTGLNDGLREFGCARTGQHVDMTTSYFESVWARASPVTGEQLQEVLNQLPELGDEARLMQEQAQRNAARLKLPELNEMPSPPREHRRERLDSESEGFVGAFISGHEEARAVARILASAIRSVPDFRRSEHWTLNSFPKKRLRLNVGMAEVATVVHDH